jgi:hypothetical protein
MHAWLCKPGMSLELCLAGTYGHDLGQSNQHNEVGCLPGSLLDSPNDARIATDARRVLNAASHLGLHRLKFGCRVYSRCRTDKRPERDRCAFRVNHCFAFGFASDAIRVSLVYPMSNRYVPDADAPYAGRTVSVVFRVLFGCASGLDR